MRPYLKQSRPTSYWLCDLAFFICAALLAWLAYKGILPISANGAVMDSDLQTYAQGMARASLPDYFTNDPVLHAATPANSIPNLERAIGSWLAPENGWASGLLAAGAVAIFIFYAGWYCLGRWLFASPALAALLAIACGITVWVGWGTFWGVTHSDPVPRVFFGALFPFLLWLALLALNRSWLRPLAMLCCGLAIWAHGISALNCGAMFFVAFLFIRGPEASLKAHLANCAICLVAFFIPVLIFLWPALNPGKTFTKEELAVFHELFELRWREDYGQFFRRLANFLSPFGQAFPILAGGMAGWIVILFLGKPRQRLLCKIAPCFLLALFLVAGFSWLETSYAAQIGRPPMGHELPRGMKFLVPLAWLLAIGGIGCLAGKIARRLILIGALVIIPLLTHDRQIEAAQYALAQMTGIRMPLAAQAERDKAKAEEYAQTMRELERIVPKGEAVYCPEDAMATRYMALRPLAHSFKDGYAHFYNKDAARSAKWLELEKLAREGPDGFAKAWEASGAPWLLCRDSADKTAIEKIGEIKMIKNGWLLARKKGIIRQSGA